MQLQSLATSPRHYGVPQWSLVSDEQLGRRWWPSLPDDITKSLHTIRRSLTTTSHSLDDNGDAGPRRMASLRRRTRTGEKSPRLCGHPRLHSMTPTFGTRQRTSSPAHRGPLLWHRPSSWWQRPISLWLSPRVWRWRRRVLAPGGWAKGRGNRYFMHETRVMGHCQEIRSRFTTVGYGFCWGMRWTREGGNWQGGPPVVTLSRQGGHSQSHDRVVPPGRGRDNAPLCACGMGTGGPHMEVFAREGAERAVREGGGWAG